MRHRLTIAIVIASSLAPTLSAQGDRPMLHPAWRVQQVIGHRGASAVAPENTLASTRAAIAAGATALEVDVRLSKDQQLVLRHDETLDKTTNGTGSIKDRTLAELKTLDAGSWFDPKFKGEKIATLAEVLAVCRGRCDVLLDLKENGDEYAGLIVAAVKEHGEEARIIVGVRSVEQAKQFRQLLPKSKQLGLIAKPDEIESYAGAGVDTIRLWPKWLTDESLVPRVRKTKVKLHLNGTTGEEAEVLELLKYEPDSLSSDDPAKLVATLADLAEKSIKTSLAQTSGELRLTGLKEPVEVRRDPWGVAHIYAQNADDLFFAQGFVAAQDRLFQIDLWRRQGNGELAEIMGPSAVEADIFARQMKYRGDMEAEWHAYSPDTKAIATAFTRGINACIEQMGDNLPLEFQLLSYKPKRWAPEDILSRSSGIYMSQNFRNEVQRLKLIDLVGIEKARWLAPIEPPRDYDVQLSADDVKHFPEKLLAGYEALTKTLYFTPSTSESNNWVVSASRSRSGKPLLASDPHRAIALPSLRYIVHLHAPGWNVIGAGEPALPGVALGHNERIAWGITIIGADTADIYVEELNSANGDEYAVGDGFQAFQTFAEEIVVKGEPQPRKVTIKHSRHGPIIYEDAKRNRAYALKWSGSEPGGAAYLPALRVARAQNETEFKAALGHWNVPGLNFVYADMDGNIGWVAATKYPIRSAPHSGLLPVPGNRNLEWSGYLSLDQYPQEFNPQAGQIVTANHNILPKGYKHPISHEFSPPYRFRQLDIQLERTKMWNLEAFRPLQQGSTSLAAKELGSHMLRLNLTLPRIGATRSRPETAMGVLIRNGDLSVDSPMGSLYALWQREFQNRLFLKHIPAEHLKLLQSLAGTQAANDAIFEPEARWFGDEPAQKCDELLSQSFNSALQKWRQMPREQQERWGALHQATFKHPLSTWSPTAAKLLNIGPFERPGDANTPNNTRYDDLFQQIHGASYRQLFDLADWDRGLATNAPGQSGQYGSPNYNDLAPLWAKGEYFPLAYSRAKVEEVTKHTMVLQPKP